jgi:Gas vesicle protein G
MGLVSNILLWPLAPVRGVVALGELIQRRVDQEMHNPARTRQQLEELEEARKRGLVSAEEEDEMQDEILDAMITPGAAERDRTRMGENDGATHS